MRISGTGLQLVLAREGVRARVYEDSGGKPTIGVGHLLTPAEVESGQIVIGGRPVSYGAGLTEAQIEALLSQDMAPVEAALNQTVPSGLGQPQFDALCSFVFNVGAGAWLYSGRNRSPCGVLRALLSGHPEDVPGQLMRWVHVGGQTDPGLVARRKGEVAQWEGRP